MLLYKYRSLADWKFVVDIFANRRLYAASFMDLNDPMEGYYRYATDSRTSHEYQRYEQEIRQAKEDWRICSLSENPLSTLMWSYYAGGHTGIVVGIEPPRRSRDRLLERVFYDNTITVDNTSVSPQDLAVRILSQKLYSWSHEQEHRVFSRTKTPFVPVRIKEVLIGCKVSKGDEDLLKSVMAALLPDVAVHKLRASELKADY